MPAPISDPPAWGDYERVTRAVNRLIPFNPVNMGALSGVSFTYDLVSLFEVPIDERWSIEQVVLYGGRGDVYGGATSYGGPPYEPAGVAYPSAVSFPTTVQATAFTGPYFTNRGIIAPLSAVGFDTYAANPNQTFLLAAGEPVSLRVAGTGITTTLNGWDPWPGGFNPIGYHVRVELQILRQKQPRGRRYR